MRILFNSIIYIVVPHLLYGDEDRDRDLSDHYAFYTLYILGAQRDKIFF